jgi:8-oxo-dGTP diphosphatase
MVDQTFDSNRWVNFAPQEHAVILFILDGEKLLLIHKKRGLGHGKINGPGGRLEPGETPHQAAVRETEEEVGLTASRLTECAVLRFIFTNGYSLEVTVFTAEAYSGELVETDEAKPFWCRRSEIPYDRMWADDRLWLPHVLDEKYVNGHFYFDEDELRESSVSVGPSV